MQQIAHWLEKLGLEQYAQRFAENDIDFDLLARMMVDFRDALPRCRTATHCCGPPAPPHRRSGR